MRANLFSTLFLALFCLGFGPAMAKPAKKLWSNARISISKNVDDTGMATIDVLSDGKLSKEPSDLFPRNSVEILWTRSGGKDIGPDVIVAGNNGGNHCGTFVYAISPGAAPPVEEVRSCVEKAKIGQKDGRPTMDCGLEFLAGNVPTNASSTILPLIWQDGKFVVDYARLLTPTPNGAQLAAIEQKIGEELGAITQNYPPKSGEPDFGAIATPQALLDLIFSGHADLAKELLARSWPKRLQGSEIYWRDLTKEFVEEPSWQKFNLKQLPHADVIAQFAAR